MNTRQQAACVAPRHSQAPAESALHAVPVQLDLFTPNPPAAIPHPVAQAPAAFLIGCAGWHVPAALAESLSRGLPASGSHLQRYAGVLPCVEINTSFYRPHLPATYARWRDSVPPGFRFSVKMPRALTHEARLRDTDGLLDRFLDEIHHLDGKLGCVLVQLPPTLGFDAFTATVFFEQLRARIDAPVVCEPRHSSWFGDAAAHMLSALKIAYVRADPPPVTCAIPDGYDGLVYFRLHGRPDIYRSSYPPAYLAGLAKEMASHRQLGRQVWCIFDNTAEGHAMPDALSLQNLADDALGTRSSPPLKAPRMPRERRP